MKYFLKPSLEHMALIKIVVTLWSQNDIRVLMANLNFALLYIGSHKGWQKIENTVIKKVPHLSLPRHLKEKLIGFIKPVGLQILEWMRYHCTRPNLCLDLPVELCWTPQGTVDKKRTAEMLIKDKNLDISNCFKLACIYCLEENILELWNKIPEDLRESFLHEEFSNEIVFLWLNGIEHEGWDITLFSAKSVFESSARRGNKAAVEYFLQKLSPTIREMCLISAVKRVTDGDVLCFLLSKMDKEQQNEVFKSNPLEVLQCFLNWPLQSFFIEMADHMWNFLTKFGYDHLLGIIINKQVQGYKDYSYKKLLGEFWLKSPIAFKKFIINSFDNRCLARLFHIKDKENCMLILKDATVIERKKLIYCDSARLLFDRLICDHEWDFLQCFIQACLPSKGERLKFKEDFEKQVIQNRVKHHLAKNKQKWDLSFCLSDGSNCKDD